MASEEFATEIVKIKDQFDVLIRHKHVAPNQDRIIFSAFKNATLSESKRQNESARNSIAEINGNPDLKDNLCEHFLQGESPRLVSSNAINIFASIEYGVDKYRKGWYFEPSTLEGDLAIGVKIKKILFHEKSKYQDIWIFESTCFGRVLVLDDIIQLTETDAFVYNEMASFLPLNSHPNPKKVLIIGCGDGGLVREITKHPLVESITLCEIDQVVIDASKKYLPFASKGFESPKLTLYVGDGSEYIRKHQGEFDVIINDAPDPTGPAMNLYKKPYYESLKQALKPGGILMSQGFVFWLDLPVIKEVMTLSREVFPVVNYATSFIGSYPGGNLGYVLCSTSPNTDFRNPIHKFSSKDLKEMGLKYYTPAVHRASMGLPLFLAEELGLKWEN